MLQDAGVVGRLFEQFHIRFTASPAQRQPGISIGRCSNGSEIVIAETGRERAEMMLAVHGRIETGYVRRNVPR